MHGNLRSRHLLEPQARRFLSASSHPLHHCVLLQLHRLSLLRVLHPTCAMRMAWRWRTILFFTAVCAILLLSHRYLVLPAGQVAYPHAQEPLHQPVLDQPHEEEEHPDPADSNGKFDWARVPHSYPVGSLKSLPSPSPGAIPKIQASFPPESGLMRQERLARLEAVKSNFTHAWNGYKKHAWLRDEVTPLSGRGQDPFGGWAATLVDSLGGLLLIISLFNAC
jgi:mannosyl-oligosaccharide alpha-1,2-mannosidase